MTYAGIRLEEVVGIVVGARPFYYREVRRGTMHVGAPVNGEPGCSWLSEDGGHEIATLVIVRKVVTADGREHDFPNGWTRRSAAHASF